jgi:hypothetical protein
MQGAGCSVGCKGVQYGGCRVQGARCKMQAGCRISAGCRVQDTLRLQGAAGSKVQEPEWRVRSAGAEVEGAECRG